MSQIIASDVEEISQEIKTFNNIPWKEYLYQKFPDLPQFSLLGNRLTEKAVVEIKDYSAKKIESMCDICQKKQIDTHGKIVIECNGLASTENIVDKDYVHMFSKEEIDQLEQIANPYNWADKNIDIESVPEKRKFVQRWYQEQMVRCTARRKVLRCGRRTGKTFSFAINILHRVLTNKDYKVMIVTPYDVQAEEIFNTIRELIHKLGPEWGTYKDIVKRDIKGSPNHLMQFANGSRIRGFTTGSSGAGTVRGQGAQLIVLDEVDYMTESDLDSILAILADNPDVELWMASTPKGKLILHKMEQIPSYKTFHFPTFVLPHYSDMLDADFKDQLSPTGYVQEIMAEYGASDFGVFQTYFVDRATNAGWTQKHRDDVLINRDNYIVVMGCDWNDDQVGTRIMCIAFDKMNKHFFVAEHDTVSKEGWSQVEAVKRIVALNRKYVFDHIYVDEGFGVSQVQFIKQFAIDQYGKLPLNHPDLKLADTVAVNFSSSLETRDVATGAVIKKDTKPYMVENAARFLERGAYILDPIYDKDLINQMYGYIIKSRSPSGRPVYAAQDKRIGDHDLDAFMIAMYGFALEYSEFINIHLSETLMQFVPKSNTVTDFSSLEGEIASEIRNLYARVGVERTRGLLNTRSTMYNRATFSSNNSMAVPSVNRNGEIFVGNLGGSGAGRQSYATRHRGGRRAQF